MLSAVDNRRYKRLLYDVLDHDPTHEDIRAFRWCPSIAWMKYAQRAYARC
jgi:hypothetical protein